MEESRVVTRKHIPKQPSLFRGPQAQTTRCWLRKERGCGTRQLQSFLNFLACHHAIDNGMIMSYRSMVIAVAESISRAAYIRLFLIESLES